MKWGFFFLILIQSNISNAALGEHVSVSSAQTQQKTMALNYSVRETQNPANTIKEYISNDGVIFAVSWQGLKRPDLSQILGSYYRDYNAKAMSLPRSKGRQITKVQTPAVTVIRGGHMRDIRGKAFAPDLVPQGFDVESIE